MNKAILGALVLVIIGSGAYWFYVESASRESASETLGSYPYTCQNGTAFTMVPASSMASIRIVPGSGTAFPESVLTQASSSAGERYEGNGLVFVGAGEDVTFTANGATTICNPVPDQENAPFNFGDAGEGAGVQQDASLAVAANIVGKWKSVDDAKYVREFEEGGRAVEWYGGEMVSEGGWVAFTSTSNVPASICFPLEAGTVYIQMALSGAVSDKLNFKVTKLTPEELELTYMDRGGVLRFTAVQ